MKYALISQRQMIEIESAFETKRLFATVKDIETIDKALKILHLLKFSDAVEITGAELAKPEQESEAYRYAKRLAEFIWAKHYKEESPDWTPLPDVLGVLTQIDNMTCGLELAKPEQEPKLTDAGADTNISRGLEPKGSGMVTLNQVGMRVDLKDALPRKPWVGLTDDDINRAFSSAATWLELTRIIEAKLKELNT
jgi:hypothetical protein